MIERLSKENSHIEIYQDGILKGTADKLVYKTFKDMVPAYDVVDPNGKSFNREKHHAAGVILFHDSEKLPGWTTHNSPDPRDYKPFVRVRRVIEKPFDIYISRGDICYSLHHCEVLGGFTKDNEEYEFVAKNLVEGPYSS